MRLLFLAALLPVLLCQLAQAAQVKATLGAPFIFTDEKASITLDPPVNTMTYSVNTITADGWGKTAEGTATVAGGVMTLSPLSEGIHIVTLQADPPVTLRFVAMTPPPPLNRAVLKKALPRSASKLLNGEPFTILEMGDSVSTTGQYGEMLVLMLQRATGNKKIQLVNRSYAGCSVDATVRQFVVDGPPNKPDLGLLMYGLNDQLCGVSLEAFLEQYQWVADHLATECHADTVYLTPTPDYTGVGYDDTAYLKDSQAGPPWLAFRTIGFATAVQQLGRRTNIPVVDTFHAVWGKGGPTIGDSTKASQALYPLHYSQQLTSMLESENRAGDTIHPNALGHLAIARAVYATMTQKPLPTPPLTITAVSEWTPAGVVSHVTVKNTSGVRREGRVSAYPLLHTTVRMDAPGEYSLDPGANMNFDVAWSDAKTPQDLVKFPLDSYLTLGKNVLPVVDFSGGTSYVYGVQAPFSVSAGYQRERQVVQGNAVKVTLLENGKARTQQVEIPKNAEVGRIPLISKVEGREKTGWAVAELVYTRMGAVLPDEATVDGDLADWMGHSWIPVGENSQARWRSGQTDNRTSLKECYLHWAFKAGKQGVYGAIRVTGEFQRDGFTIFFDPRDPQELGTAGRYYWVWASIHNDGVIGMQPGSTTTKADGMNGKWQATADGGAFEFFIPYTLFEQNAWPASGELGLGIDWAHFGKLDKPTDPGWSKETHLQWSEDAHPWNPRCYGVLRLVQDANEPLPYIVRVR